MAPRERGPLARYVSAAWSVAGAITAGSAIGLALLTTAGPGPWRDAASAIVAACLGIGALQVLAEASLRAQITQDIFEALDARIDSLRSDQALLEAIRPSGVRAVTRATVDWREVWLGANKVDLVPADVSNWVDRQLASLIDVARSSPLVVTVHLPNVPSMADELRYALAVRTGHTEVADLITSYNGAVKAAREAWQKAGRNTGTKLVIKTYDAIPGFEVVLTNKKAVLSVPGVQGERVGEPAITHVYADGTDAGFREWFREQIEALGSVEIEVLR